MFEIEKGISIPSPVYRYYRRINVPKTLKSMDIGDSFLIPASSHVNNAPFWTAARKIGIKLCSRRIGNDIRFWRIA